MPTRSTSVASQSASHGAPEPKDSDLRPTRENLTEARLKELTPPLAEDRELRLHDAKQPGLLLRWRPGSPKPRWYISKRVRDRMVRSPLGELSSWPDVSVTKARELAVAALADLANGISPADKRAKARQDKAEKKAAVVPMAKVVKAHLALLLQRGRTDGHRREIELLGENLIAAGITDLRKKDVSREAGEWVASRDLAGATKRRWRAHIKDLGQTALREYDLVKNPFSTLEVGAPVVVDVELFSLAECISLMSDKSMGHAWGPLGAVLLYHGLRLQEGVWLHWDRIDPEAGVLRVTAPTPKERAAGYQVKRNKSREVPLQEECLAILERLPKQDDGYLFPLEFRSLHRKRHWDSFHKWTDAQGIVAGGRHPHTLRHQRATVGLASNEGELRLQLSLGHAGPEMTAHYSKQAFQWKKTLGHWRGIMHWRNPAEIARLIKTVSKPEKAAV